MTPYDEIIDVFHSMFQSTEELPESLERQFLLNAISEYELELTPLNFDKITLDFKSPLTYPQIQILGMLMYKNYLGRYLDRVLKLNNVIGRDIQLTGLANTKAQVNRAYEGLCEEIGIKMSKMKEIKFD
ncbi:hypothetical protein AB684_11620 [Bacillus licheniformis]|uniref:hypothetical protein n=1 Tax=Bacillus TaxID=1386 RepID=UPI0003672DF5|nr:MULTISPECIES: hypothetical protein [Bacillus subtilis group]AMR10801.1 hypothetical protein AB684_11620 [Bacillus licheniformis]KJH58681.1 hypothetical protein UF14_09720 [Bacillus licheniformis]MCM3374214.1 hypothetical protein [Bacillus licheniformis]MCM3433635.1 hypothetical protein [Bacillus licheniformis]MCM3462123.1 hypothetical protein [Bacillus licheniformis]